MSGTRRKAGQLGPQVEGYRGWLARRGYTTETVRHMLKDLGQVGRWMSSQCLETAQLNEDVIATFLAARREAGHRRVPGTRAMAPLLSYLRGAGAAPAAQPSQTPLGAVLGQYRSWLVQDRGLAATTVLRYENTARRFTQRRMIKRWPLQPAQKRPRSRSTAVVLTGLRPSPTSRVSVLGLMWGSGRSGFRP